MEIAVRAYSKQKNKFGDTSPKPYELRQYDSPNFDRLFTFDTESRTANKNDNKNMSQALTFGSFVIMYKDVLEKIGIFIILQR